MTRWTGRAFSLGALALLVACSQAAPNPAVVRGAGISGAYVSPAAGPWALQRLCPRPENPREMRCEAIRRTDVGAMHPAGAPQGFSPADLQSAYGLASASAANGGGQTVAIVDAFDDPKAESDLGVYRATYGLPACTTVNGCFRKVNQRGQPSPLPSSDRGWAGEESLDLDMVSAICPNCRILFVETTINGIDAGVNTAAALGANVISNSYGGGEYSRNDPAYDHPGITITAAAGDGDYYDCDPASAFGSPCTGPEQPASFANVVAVGGTHLERDASARGWSERVWNDVTPRNDYYGGTGSGCSRLVSKPAWQTDHGCTMRSETDVSAVGDPNTPVAVYDSFGGGGWGADGGTSVSSPLVAGVFALAGNAASVAQPQGLWEHAGAGLSDVTAGDNLVPLSVFRRARKCPAAWRYICYAGPGYDGPSGWGTPQGTGGF